MYEEWKTKKNYSPNTIKLDAKNPRLHDVPSNATPRDLINLFTTQPQLQTTIRKLAKSIVDKGYFPHEDIILVEEGNYKIVVEGNCRICACKILINPDLVKDQREKRYFKSLSKKLTERAKNSFMKISCSIAPDREQAYVLIESRHTVTPIVSWTQYAQGNFYRTLLREGQSIHEISDKFSRPTSVIRERIRIAETGDTIMHLPSASDELRSYSTDTKKLSEASGIILRLLLLKEAKREFGIKLEVEDDGSLTSNLSEADFLGILTSLAEDALVNKDSEGKPLIDTRVLGTIDKQKEYLKRYTGYRPQGIEGNRFNSSTFLTSDRAYPETNEAGSGRALSTPKKPKRTKRSTDHWLINPEVEINIKSEKVRALVEEAQKLKWGTVPHTAGLLLRAIIELSLKARMKELDLWNDIVKTNNGNPTVGLSKLIAKTIKDKTVLDDTELNEAFNLDFHKTDNNKRFKLVLDFIQHNEQHRITKEDLARIRSSTESLIRHLVDTLPARTLKK